MSTAVPYAVSVHGFIDKIGADLGVASLVGVALLIIMVFVQARETALLRERAEDAEDRLTEFERYAEQVGRQAAYAQQVAETAQAQAAQTAAAVPSTARPGQLRPAPAPAAARTAAARPAAAAPSPTRTVTATPVLPAAAAGLGAPALASATRLIPLPEPAPAPAPVPVAPPAAPVPAAPVTVAPPSTAAAGAPPVVPPPNLAPPRDREPARAATVAGAERAPRRDYGREEDEGGSRLGRGSLAIAAILVAVIVVAAVLVITHHSSSSRATDARAAVTTKTKPATSTTRRKGTVSVNPNHFRVAVLNGTETTNLAADVSAKLSKVGFQQGETANYADQTETGTTVGYLPGDRAPALAVAKALGIDASSVQQVTSTARGIVCPSGATGCADQVVVVVGADLNSDA